MENASSKEVGRVFCMLMTKLIIWLLSSHWKWPSYELRGVDGLQGVKEVKETSLTVPQSPAFQPRKTRSVAKLSVSRCSWSSLWLIPAAAIAVIACSYHRHATRQNCLVCVGGANRIGDKTRQLCLVSTQFPICSCKISNILRTAEKREIGN